MLLLNKKKIVDINLFKMKKILFVSLVTSILIVLGTINSSAHGAVNIFKQKVEKS